MFLQAAVGSFALDIAIQRNEGPEAERLGREVILPCCICTTIHNI